MMKKVLIIAYAFPPRTAIGAQRPYKLAKYLPSFGWEPVILTAKLPGVPPRGFRVIESEFRDLRKDIKMSVGLKPEEPVGKRLKKAKLGEKLIKLGKELISYPDPHRSWLKYAYKSAADFIAAEKTDAIISTSSPVTAHLIANKLKERFHIPWVADLRDLWTKNHFYKKSFPIKFLERRLELKTLSHADALVTVTEGFADDLSLLHGRKVHCITNGYDKEDFYGKESRLRKKFTITYTGTLYGGKRDPSPLLKTIKELAGEGLISPELIEVRFYCPGENWLPEAVRKFGLNGSVTFSSSVSRAEALRRQQESHLLLLILDGKGAEKDVYPAKVFEYFGARRPILAFGGESGIIAKLLEKTGTGQFASSPAELKRHIMEHYAHYLKKTCTEYAGKTDAFTYERIARTYARLLSDVSR